MTMHEVRDASCRRGEWELDEARRLYRVTRLVAAVTLAALAVTLVAAVLS